MMKQNQNRTDESLLDYPGYCLVLSLVFTGAVGLGTFFYTV